MNTVNLSNFLGEKSGDLIETRFLVGREDLKVRTLRLNKDETFISIMCARNKLNLVKSPYLRLATFSMYQM